MISEIEFLPGFDIGDTRMTDSSMSTYEQRKAREARRQAEQSAEGRDIGEIPAVMNPERRERCRTSLREFMATYFPNIFYLEWADFQLDTIGRLQNAALHGDQFAIAMPRGSGKTKMCECTAIWSALYGYRHFIVLIGSEDKSTREMFHSIKSELECNELLNEDFPEVCYPINALERITNRAKGQTYHGEHTYIEWSESRVILPTIPGSVCSGTVIYGTTLTGRLRGLNVKTADGRSLRPEFVLIDDPQTRESAKSLSQTADRMALIKSDVMGMCGPGKTMTIVMPCTVIYQNDLADQMLNRTLNPTWHGKRHQLVEGMPINMKLWHRYWEIRSEALRHDKGYEECNRFYIANRDAMDEGCTPLWPQRFTHDEISAVQNAMNIFLEDPQRFFSECQNTPQGIDMGEAEKITLETIFGRLNNRKRLEIPQAATHLTMFVDVQKNLLYWMLMGFSDDFTSWIIDYNTFPEQPRSVFKTSEASPTYCDVFPSSGQEGALRRALEECIIPMLQRSYRREDGADLSIERCLVDSGYCADTIYKFVQESGYKSVLMASKGRGINATMIPISEYKRKNGEIISQNEWHISPLRNNRAIRMMNYDTNWWKSCYRNRILTSKGDAGALTICGENLDLRTQMLADHLSAEYSVPESSGSRRCDIWKLLPNRENHWFDGVIGCMVAASERGCQLPDNSRPVKKLLHRLIGQPQSRDSARNSFSRRSNSSGPWVGAPMMVGNSMKL